MYLGSWKIDDYLTIPVNTHTPLTGAATDADAVPTYRVYKDDGGTPVENGSLAKLDDANTTGFYVLRIQLDAGSGYEAGKSYTIYVSATVGTIVGTLSHTFQIQAEVALNVITTKLDGIEGAGFVTGTDSLEAIRDRGDAAWTTGGSQSGSGSIEWTYTITNSVGGSPIADVDVWVTTDLAGANSVADGKTDAFGAVTFYLDPGTYYIWSQKSGFNFDNPDTEVVS